MIPPLTAKTALEQVFVRVEDQHLLKLPETGAIAFGIRILSFAWGAVMQNPVIAVPVLEKLRTMPPETAHYKAVADFIPSAVSR